MKILFFCVVIIISCSDNNNETNGSKNAILKDNIKLFYYAYLGDYECNKSNEKDTLSMLVKFHQLNAEFDSILINGDTIKSFLKFFDIRNCEMKPCICYYSNQMYSTIPFYSLKFIKSTGQVISFENYRNETIKVTDSIINVYTFPYSNYFKKIVKENSASLNPWLKKIVTQRNILQ